MFPESKDVFLTPFAAFGEMYGVEILAQWIEALRQKAYLEEPPFLIQLLVALLFFVLLGGLHFSSPSPSFFQQFFWAGHSTLVFWK